MEKKRLGNRVNNTNSFGVAGVILGILSIVFGLGIFLGAFAGMALAVVGLVFALRQRKVYSNAWSTWGIVLSILGLFINLVIIILLIQFIKNQIIPIIEQAAQQAQELQQIQYEQ